MAKAESIFTPPPSPPPRLALMQMQGWYHGNHSCRYAILASRAETEPGHAYCTAAFDSRNDFLCYRRSQRLFRRYRDDGSLHTI